MSRFQRYLQLAEAFIRDYDGSVPLPFYLKPHFSADKKLGSRDRKAISSIVYSYFRTGLALGKEPSADNLLFALFLCAQPAGGTLEALSPNLFGKILMNARERLSYLGLSPVHLFPYQALLDPERNAETFALSLLQQPDLFLRIRPGKFEKVTRMLTEAGVPYSKAGNMALRLPNGTKLDGLIAINRDAVIQDLSSQQVFDGLPIDAFAGTLPVWDACAASGGKSILLNDLYMGGLKLTISDKRKTVLHNARIRLSEAGVPVQEAFVEDLEHPDILRPHAAWPMVICDVPCTGSGTWGRTPEQLYFFREEMLSRFSALQRAILRTVSGHCTPGGMLVYITCSVFEAENHSIVKSLPASGFELISSRYLDGTGMGADSMFAAVFRVPVTG